MSAAAPAREAAREHERELDLFGSHVRICAGIARGPAPAPELAAFDAERRLRQIHDALSRFLPESELCGFNRRDRRTVAVSPLMGTFAVAAKRAFELSDGLVDARVIGAVEDSGYRRSRIGVEPAALREALAAAPARRAALPGEGEFWSELAYDSERGTLTCDPGVRLDSGGVGKGLAADLCAARLGGLSSFAVDCGGDLNVGGADSLERRVELTDPFSGAEVGSFPLASGAVATSGLRRRVWATDSGFAHHLIDPGRGVPAWTGLVQATAVAPSAVEAEALAKAALLAGPSGAGDHLSRWGGIVFDDDGRPTAYGPLLAQLEPARGDR